MPEERLLDPVTAVSASGPAYVFWFIEQLAASAEKLGIPKDAALKLAKQTVLGAAQLASASADSPETLRKNVTSRAAPPRRRSRCSTRRSSPSASRARSRRRRSAAKRWAASWEATRVFGQIGVYLVDTVVRVLRAACCSRASTSSGCACRSATRWASSCSRRRAGW